MWKKSWYLIILNLWTRNVTNLLQISIAGQCGTFLKGMTMYFDFLKLLSSLSKTHFFKKKSLWCPTVREGEKGEGSPTDEHSISLLNVSFNSIQTSMKGAVKKISKITRRYKSVKNTSVGFQESESEMDSLISTKYLSS